MHNCHNPELIRAELSNLDRYYYRKITTTTKTTFPQLHLISNIIKGSTYWNLIIMFIIARDRLQWKNYKLMKSTQSLNIDCFQFEYCCKICPKNHCNWLKYIRYKKSIGNSLLAKDKSVSRYKIFVIQLLI